MDFHMWHCRETLTKCKFSLFLCDKIAMKMQDDFMIINLFEDFSFV